MVMSGAVGESEGVVIVMLTAPDSFSAFGADSFLHIEALQNGGTIGSAAVQVYLPPLITIHGIWSSSDTWQPFVDFLGSSAYPSVLVDNFDYSDRNAYAFNDLVIQARLLTHVLTALDDCRNTGIACSRVDLLGHSMGGLISRYFADSYSQTDRVHSILTLATPHVGSLSRQPFLPTYGLRDLCNRIHSASRNPLTVSIKGWLAWPRRRRRTRTSKRP